MSLRRDHLLLLLLLLLHPLASSAAAAAAAAAEECERTYGVLPCTKTTAGNLFLLLSYGFLMYKAATCLSSGSELLLQILGPGIVGGLFLPILGALPDALIILVSGLSGNKETAQNQVLIGMGLLAGSTVMLLTLLWGSCIVAGKCDLSDDFTSVDSQDTKRFSLFGSGVSVDLQTSYSARIMVVSVIPFIIVQLPKVFKFPSGQRIALLLSLVAAALILLSYCLYQVFQPWIQKRRLEYAKLKYVISGIFKHAQNLEALERLLNEDGTISIPDIKKLFRHIDSDSDGMISHAELHAFVVGIQFEEIDLDKADAVDQVMDEFDISHDNYIDEEEFIKGISKWIRKAKHAVGATHGYSKRFLDDFHMKTRDEHNKLIDKSDGVTDSTGSTTWRSRTCIKAILLLLLGTAIAALFADPLVDAVHNFSLATHIPSFFISFIAMPLATNSSEAVSAIIFASQKRQRTLSLTFSEIYGGATMNNTLCLAVFLVLVYVRHLKWDFSAEVLIILIVCVVMGLFASFRTTLPLWTCFVAFLLYPSSLAVVYVLDFVFGWS